MKNKLNLLLVLAIIVFIIGCSCGKTWEFGKSEPTKNEPTKTTEKQANGDNPTKTGNSSNKSLTDRATDVVTEGEKIGIPECDELMDYFRSKIENEDTDFVTKAILKTMESQFREGIKKSIEENKADRTETAKFCKEFKKNLDEQEQKQKK